MKTAIQELFSKLEIEHPNLFNTNTLEGRQFINDYYKFFELEKQQIIDADLNGSIRTAESADFRVSFLRIKELGEKYYKETFGIK
jgi:hypothetical protein